MVWYVCLNLKYFLSASTSEKNGDRERLIPEADDAKPSDAKSTEAEPGEDLKQLQEDCKDKTFFLVYNRF